MIDTTKAEEYIRMVGFSHGNTLIPVNNALHALSLVEEIKTGTWNHITSVTTGATYVWCSVCGESPACEDYASLTDCPSCGAKIEGGNE